MRSDVTMLDRIIEISSTAARLQVKNSLLAIRIDEDNETTIPLSEIGVLLLSNPAGSLTNAVLAQLAENGAMVVVCGNDYLPSAMLLPTKTVTRQSERFQKQAAASAPLKKQLWKEIIIQKISNQGSLLKFLYQSDANLEKLSKLVKSDDSENIEGRAARIYWSKLNLMNKRDRNNQNDANALLNYGYTVLLAACARGICSVGLHPTLGIHHHNQFNSFCLASDIMEPYRIIVDRAVCALSSKTLEVNQESKRFLISQILDGFVKINNQKEKILNAISLTSESLMKIYCGDKDSKLLLPSFIYEHERKR